ncbi:hypothetical protein [Variovorax sp. CAN15]|uniref:hypothetical protein n=1 Tax=Variovorax sp. CAN15 TaxID=3046727 RepID=UPI002648B3DD|nr:hypothetical protein [Variovorax sp. CAN15]
MIMKSVIDICTRKSSDGRRIFVDRMLISIDDVILGSEDATCLSDLLVGEIDRLMLNIEKQKDNINFARSIFDQRMPPEYFFQLLHNACWVEGDWPGSLGASAVEPSVYIGLPGGNEIFDADEVYFVVVDSMDGILLCRKRGGGELVMLKVNVHDYVDIWRRAKSEIIS